MLNKVLVICGIVMMIFLGCLSIHENGRQTSAELDREIQWEMTHQTIRPMQ